MTNLSRKQYRVTQLAGTERPFDNATEAGGLRYCIDSPSLRFIPVDELESEGYGAYRALFEPDGE